MQDYPQNILLESIYFNKIVLCRPKAGVIVMFKILVLQQWHVLSAFKLEKQFIDRISLRKFLDFLLYIPDIIAVCSFRKIFYLS